MKNKKKKKATYKIFLYLLISIMFIFYLRQQYLIIKLQNKIKETYENIAVLESENKKLSIEFQKLLSEDRLRALAKEFKFVPITDKDIMVVKIE